MLIDLQGGGKNPFKLSGAYIKSAFLTVAFLAVSMTSYHAVVWVRAKGAGTYTNHAGQVSTATVLRSVMSQSSCWIYS